MKSEMSFDFGNLLTLGIYSFRLLLFLKEVLVLGSTRLKVINIENED